MRPFYWLEESAELYTKVGSLVASLRRGESVLANSQVDALADLDADLIQLWRSFEKEAVEGIRRVVLKQIPPLCLPAIFGFPKVVYYYHGILLFQISRTDVDVCTFVGVEKE